VVLQSGIEVQPAARSQGPPSEAEFIRVLRDHALGVVDVEGSNRVVGLTSGELEERIRLSRTSVSSLLSRFRPILQGQQADGTPVRGSGQPVRWTIDPDAGVIVGIELGPEDPPSVALSDLYGRIGDRVLVAETHPANADKALDWVKGAIKTLLGDRTDDDVVGVGVSVAAPIERESGVIRAEFGSRLDSRWVDWQLTRLREQINDRLGWAQATVLLDNDANLSALAEYIWGAGRQSFPDRTPYQNVVYLEWSWGIGMGLILLGQLYRGGGIAGEIGHTIVRGDDEPDAGNEDPDPCERCHKHGCLEAVAGLRAILKQLPSAPSKPPPFTCQDLIAAAALADSPDHAPIFKAAATRIDRVLGPVIHLLNPELVIIGGEIGWFGYEAVKGPLLEALKNYTMRPALTDVAVVPAKLTKHSTLEGAISLMLRPTPGDPDALLAFLQRKSRP
jgi:predicted NBD/HSP70 family sugar kinase